MIIKTIKFVKEYDTSAKGKLSEDDRVNKNEFRLLLNYLHQYFEYWIAF